MEIKIKLKVKDVEIELSLDELKELKSVIEDLTEKRIEYVRDVPYILYFPTYPEPWIHWGISGSASDNTTDYTVMYKG